MAIRRRRKRSPTGPFTALVDQFGRRRDPVCGGGRRPDAGAGLSGCGGDQARAPQSRADKIRAAGAADPYDLSDLAVAIGEGADLHRSGGRDQRLALWLVWRLCGSFQCREPPLRRNVRVKATLESFWLLVSPWF